LYVCSGGTARKGTEKKHKDWVGGEERGAWRTQELGPAQCGRGPRHLRVRGLPWNNRNRTRRSLRRGWGGGGGGQRVGARTLGGKWSHPRGELRVGNKSKEWWRLDGRSLFIKS